MTVPVKQQPSVPAIQSRVDPTAKPQRDNERAHALAELSNSLAEAIGDSEGVLQRIVRLISDFLGDTAVIRLLGDTGTAMDVAAVCDSDHAVQARVEAVLASSPTVLREMDPYARAIREARLVALADSTLVDSLRDLPQPVCEGMAELDVRAILICPLRARGQVIGTLGLWRRGERPAHSARDKEFAQELADRAALAIDNARLVDSLRAEVEERKRTQADMQLSSELLHRGEEKRRVLMTDLVAAEEEQRRRIAIDVHDDSIQAMAALALRLQVLRRHAPTQEFAENIGEIEQTVIASIGRLRRLLFQLDSSVLNEGGLARALSRYVDELFPDATPATTFRTSIEVEPPPLMRTVLYRIAQEALNNVRKHAGATRVRVVISPLDEGVLVSVQDDGMGFDVDAVGKRSLPGHLGLRSMLERATVADGWLTIDSKPGSGTEVRFWLPTLAELAGDREASVSPRS
jgi:signal transduction histidine kinase